MVGSQGGAPKDPAWVADLREHPDQVTVQDGPEPWDGVAREVTGEEKRQWWTEPWPSTRRTRSTSSGPTGRSRSSWWSAPTPPTRHR